MACEGVFIVGCPRSGTTVFGHALRRLGFAELGELGMLKAVIPELMSMDVDSAARAIDEVLASDEVADLSDGLPASIAIPEMVLLLEPLARLAGGHRVIHLIRDPRDVMSSLLEKGWLSDDPSVHEEGSKLSPEWATGTHSRFWTEPDRCEEFPQVSDARRAAWCWRRFVEAGLTLSAVPGEPFVQRYESLCLDPHEAVKDLAPLLERTEQDVFDAFDVFTTERIGRWVEDLSDSDLAELEAEASALLGRLGIDLEPVNA